MLHSRVIYVHLTMHFNIQCSIQATVTELRSRTSRLDQTEICLMLKMILFLYVCVCMYEYVH